MSRKDLKTAAIATTVGVGLLTIASLLWPWTPMALRSDLNAEVAERKNLQTSISRLAEVVELQAVIASEDHDSAEFHDALDQLRRLRRVRIAEQAK